MRKTHVPQSGEAEGSRHSILLAKDLLAWELLTVTHDMKTHCWGCSAAMFIIGVTAVFGQSPPINDDFDNRAVLSGSSATFSGNLENSTLEAGEPPPLYGS